MNSFFHLQEWQPTTGTELQAVIAEYPEHAHRWRPAADQVGTLGEQLAVATGQAALKPVPEVWQERILSTLIGDEQFCAALRNILELGGGAV